jgi:hypothetical protein
MLTKTAITDTGAFKKSFRKPLVFFQKDGYMK